MHNQSNPRRRPNRSGRSPASSPTPTAKPAPRWRGFSTAALALVTAAAAGAGLWWASQPINPKAPDHPADKQADRGEPEPHEDGDRRAKGNRLDEAQLDRLDDLRGVTATTTTDLAAMGLDETQVAAVLDALVQWQRANDAAVENANTAREQARTDEERGRGRAGHEERMQDLEQAKQAREQLEAQLATAIDRALPEAARAIRAAAAAEPDTRLVERYLPNAERLEGDALDQARAAVDARIQANIEGIEAAEAAYWANDEQ